jgi:ParB family chromosome partitioning protein
MAKLISLSEIYVPENVRRSVDPKSIQELKKSILAVRKVSGGEKTLLQPIVVQRYEGPRGDQNQYKYELRYGFRRYEAFTQLFAEKPNVHIWAKQIPCNVDQFLDDEEGHAGIVYQLIENVHREAMNSMDEAYAVERLMKEAKCNQTQAAKTLGKTKGWVTQRLNLLKLDETVQSEIQDGKMTTSQAREMTRLKDKEDQKEALKELKAKEEKTGKKPKLQDTKDVVSKKKGDPPPEKPKEEAPPAPEPNSDLGHLTHEQKVAYAKDRAAARKAGEPDPPIPDAGAPTPPAPPPGVDVELPAKLQKEADKAKARVDKAKDFSEKAFFDGVKQALEYAQGDRKTIRFNKAAFKD